MVLALCGRGLVGFVHSCVLVGKLLDLRKKRPLALFLWGVLTLENEFQAPAGMPVGWM